MKQNNAPVVVALVFGVPTGVVAERLLITPRSRHIPASERRKAIVRYERKAGRRYTPKEDELDHDIAFARWGSSSR